MPITTPIEGAGFGPIVARKYPVFGAVDVSTHTRTASMNGLEIEGLTKRASLNAAVIEKTRPRPILSGLQVINYTRTNVLQALEIMSGETLMILADIIASELSAASLALQAFVDINARLLIDDVEVPIKDFNFQKPTGRLGSALNVTLADPNYEIIEIGASIDFSIIVTVGATEHPYPLMVNSALSEDDFSIKYRGGQNGGPIDSVTFGALDVTGDRFTKTPLRPVVMFDPSRVQRDNVLADPENAIRDESTGRVILPIIEPVTGLTMKKVLHRAYTSIGGSYADRLSPIQRSQQSWGHMYVGDIVDGSSSAQAGCGFNTVITNIEDYRVRQAQFTIENGWHGGARPVVEMFSPVYFPAGPDGNNLVILDVDQPLEFGVSVYDVLLSYHKSLSQRRSYRPDTNQVLLTYQYMGNDPYENAGKLWREVERDPVYPVNTATDTENPISAGEEGYVKHTLRERVREYYQVDDPDNVLDTQPVLTVLTVEQTYVLRDDSGGVVFSGVRTSSIERTEHYYNGDLKWGHTRTLETRVFTPETLSDRLESQMLTAQRERCYITWTDDPSRPGVKLQESNRLDLSELCVVSPEAQTIWVDGEEKEHYPVIPLLEANLGGYLTNEWKLTGMLKSLTRTSLLQKRKGNQHDVIVTEVDHLNGGGARTSISEPVVGTTRHDQYEVRSRTLLLKDDASIAEIGPRIPEAVNAYELPRDRAIELGYRRLYRLTNPLKNMPVDLPTPDFALDRGSVIRGQTRNGYTGNFLVTGLAITGQALGKQGEHRIFQNLETIELLPQ
jgi:hypothetical protein